MRRAFLRGAARRGRRAPAGPRTALPSGVRVAGVALSLLAGAAVAEEPWEGRWVVDPANCRAELGDAAGFDIRDGEMRFYESTCRIADAAPTGVDGAWVLETQCTGEGETWTRRMVLMLSGEHWQVLTLFEGDFLEYERCR